MSRLNALAATVATMVLGACAIHHEPQYQSISAEGWALADTIIFAPSKDHVAWTQIHVRTSELYPFTQLAIELTCDTLCDTLTIDIAPAARMQLSQSRKELPYPVSAPIHLRHIMATDTLHGVHNIGLE